MHKNKIFLEVEKEWRGYVYPARSVWLFINIQEARQLFERGLEMVEWLERQHTDCKEVEAQDDN